MGMFDDVSLFMPCPECNQYSTFDLQTKDLECSLYQYRPLNEDWFTNPDEGFCGQKKLRDKLPVFPSFPYDKSAEVWANQSEQTEASAKPSEEIAKQLKYVIIYGDCPKCKAGIEGKIKIENGYLMKPLYDVISQATVKEG